MIKRNVHFFTLNIKNKQTGCFERSENIRNNFLRTLDSQSELGFKFQYVQYDTVASHFFSSLVYEGFFSFIVHNFRFLSLC